MHTQWESLANTHILGIAPYEPGKPIEELEREYGVHDAIKLASNENPLPPSERVQRAITAQLAHLNRYPDGSGFYLRQALAKKHGFTQDQIVLGNGSNELIELAVRTFLKPGDEAIVPHPSFVVYPMIVQAAGGIRVMVMLREHRLDLEAMARAITPTTKMVFVANPNNPTATIVTADEVEAFMARVPERTIVIFDEAYIEFAMGPDFPDALNYIRQGRKVIVLRTFSKAASLAGLRVGYGIADADAISLMNRIRQPFNVNSLAQAAGLAALEDENHVLECVRMIEVWRARSSAWAGTGGGWKGRCARAWWIASPPTSRRVWTAPTASCSRPPCSRTSACWNRSGAACPPEPSSPMSAPPSAASWPSPSGWAPDARSRSSAAIPWPARRRAAGRAPGAAPSPAPPPS